jgi:hypothetical protein
MSNDMLGRLMRTNDELLKGVHWLMATNNVEAALKFLPVAEAFASLLTEMTVKQSEVHRRRGKMSLVKKPRR